MRALLSGISAVALVLLVACGDDDGFSPTVETVAGTYSASSFTATTTAGTVDLLALGAVVSVTLVPDGTTSGQLLVPVLPASAQVPLGGEDDGSDLDADLTGTWALAGSTVTFTQTADTFIQDADFTASRNRLTGEGVFSGVTLRLVLTKPE